MDIIIIFVKKILTSLNNEENKYDLKIKNLPTYQKWTVERFPYLDDHSNIDTFLRPLDKIDIETKLKKEQDEQYINEDNILFNISDAINYSDKNVQQILKI